MERLMNRADFKEAVFRRDEHVCVCCGAKAVDAHHILERKLYTDGGYYLSNGSSLCGACHLKAEDTSISVEEIRLKCGISDAVLPEGFSADRRYDKWGNEILADGRRRPGPLFEDPGARKILGRLLYDGTFVYA